MRRARGPALALAAVALLGVAGTLPVVLQRGFTAEPVAAEAGTVRILSWNINGHLVAPAVVARLAAQQHADVVVLPEITGAARFPGAFAAAGLRLRAYPAVTDRSAQTFVFVRSGRYSPVVGHSGDPVKSAALTPLDPAAPAVVAVHGAQPTLRENALWRSDLAWVTAKCSDPDTVAVGDFNATLDDFGADGLGGCTDAAADRHAASIGTWPTRLPAWLGMPLDHVLIGRDWTVRSFTVLTDEDGSGARHRPILAVLGRSR